MNIRLGKAIAPFQMLRCATPIHQLSETGKSSVVRFTRSMSNAICAMNVTWGNARSAWRQNKDPGHGDESG